MASLKKRGKKYYEQYYEGGGSKRENPSTDTEKLQVAKDKVRNHESKRFRGQEIAYPTKTPIAEVVGKFARSLYADLKKKAALVEWGTSTRKDTFALFSRKGFTSDLMETARKEGIHLVAVGDMEEL
jgi:hypothetical protein